MSSLTPATVGSPPRGESSEREATVEQRNVNPWSWQDQYGFSQAVEVTAGERVLFCAGQTSTGEDGSTLHGDDMRAQTLQALDNVETVLRDAGMSLANVVRLNYYVTDVDR
jgi:enamine deaminase RidA (YjgF/YER057c/UK114 family)